MNRLLAETLTVLNGVIAVAIFIVGLVFGYRISGGTMMGTLSGGFAGFLLAALTCGAISYLALIERHLSVLAGLSSTQDGPVFLDPNHRRDPTL